MRRLQGIRYVCLLAAISAAAWSETVPKGLSASDWNSIRAEYERRRLDVVRTGSEYVAGNPHQQMLARFDGRGFSLEPFAGGWKWGLEIEQASRRPARVRTAGARITYEWDNTLEEWFVNDQRGLEHGFTLKEGGLQPARGFSPALKLNVRGGLQPRVHPDRRGADFLDSTGQSVIQYAGLKVWDADGKILPARLEAEGQGLRLHFDSTAARYPITIDPIAQQAYLKASNTRWDAQFGFSVAVSGDTAVVGAPYEDSSSTGVNSTPADGSASGAAYVFVRNAGVWTQQAYLKASNTGVADDFGFSVAVSGDTVVVGAPGESSSTTGVNTAPNDNSQGSGATYVFVRNAGMWSQQAYLKASYNRAGDQFGRSVAVSGDTIVIGASGDASSTTGVNSIPNEGAAQSGAAYVFVRNSGVWAQEAYLKASNTGANDFFGNSAAISGETLVVGARGEDSSTTGVNSTPDEGAGDSGAAYVFVRNSGAWTQQAYLKASNTGADDAFGWSVAISGDTAVVGAPNEDSSTTGVNTTSDEAAGDSGAAYVFVRNSGQWTQQAYLKTSNTEANERLGLAVAISGDTVVAGASQENSSTTGVNSTPDDYARSAGAAFIFIRNSSVWTEQAYLKASNTEEDDGFGASVAVSGDTVVVGAYQEDSSATGVNGNQSDNSREASGAAYIFTIPPPACPITAQLTLSPNQLTPPDHRLVEVTASLQIPACVSGPQVKLISIKSSDKDSGAGPGDLPKDIQQASYGANDRKFLLRAERFNKPASNIITNKRRTYTVTYQVKDSSNKSKTVRATVTVP